MRLTGIFKNTENKKSPEQLKKNRSFTNKNCNDIFKRKYKCKLDSVTKNLSNDYNKSNHEL